MVVEVLRARAERQFVGRPATIMKDQVQLGQPAVQQGLEVAEILHPLGQGVVLPMKMIRSPLRSSSRAESSAEATVEATGRARADQEPTRSYAWVSSSSFLKGGFDRDAISEWNGRFVPFNFVGLDQRAKRRTEGWEGRGPCRNSVGVALFETSCRTGETGRLRYPTVRFRPPCETIGVIPQSMLDLAWLPQSSLRDRSRRRVVVRVPLLSPQRGPFVEGKKA